MQRNALIAQPEEITSCGFFGSADTQECLFHMEQISKCHEFSLNFIGEVIARINLLLWTCGVLILNHLDTIWLVTLNSKLTKY